MCLVTYEVGCGCAYLHSALRIMNWRPAWATDRHYWVGVVFSQCRSYRIDMLRLHRTPGLFLVTYGSFHFSFPDSWWNWRSDWDILYSCKCKLSDPHCRWTHLSHASDRWPVKSMLLCSFVMADALKPGSHGSSAAWAGCSTAVVTEGSGMLRSYVVSSDCLQCRVQDVSPSGTAGELDVLKLHPWWNSIIRALVPLVWAHLHNTH